MTKHLKFLQPFFVSSFFCLSAIKIGWQLNKLNFFSCQKTKKTKSKTKQNSFAVLFRWEREREKERERGRESFFKIIFGLMRNFELEFEIPLKPFPLFQSKKKIKIKIKIKMNEKKIPKKILRSYVSYNVRHQKPWPSTKNGELFSLSLSTQISKWKLLFILFFNLLYINCDWLLPIISFSPIQNGIQETQKTKKEKRSSRKPILEISPVGTPAIKR